MGCTRNGNSLDSELERSTMQWENSPESYGHGKDSYGHVKDSFNHVKDSYGHVYQRVIVVIQLFMHMAHTFWSFLSRNRNCLKTIQKT